MKRSRSGASRATPTGAPTSTSRETRSGMSSAKAAASRPPIEFAAMSTVGRSSASRMSVRNRRAWSNKSTPL
jgi:hypothetical protein